jgi:hypothetical protein
MVTAMANDLIKLNNPFLQAAAQLKRSGKIDRSELIDVTPVARRSTRARLNFIPDSDTLAAMIDRGLEALSRGLRWDRGAILNLLV